MVAGTVIFVPMLYMPLLACVVAVVELGAPVAATDVPGDEEEVVG